MEPTVNPYRADRAEMVGFVPGGVRTVLDVGCANGGFGLSLRAVNPTVKVWGIDPNPGSGVDAYEEVAVGSYPEGLPGVGRFDCIVFNDVLEHMIDPWDALVQSRDRLTPGGCVVASLPNLRCVRVLRDLVLRGTFEYEDYGVRDRTHLRFFTPKTMVSLFEDSGYRVVSVQPILLPDAGRRGLLRRLSFGLLDGVLAEQYAVVASPSSTSS